MTRPLTLSTLAQTPCSPKQATARPSRSAERLERSLRAGTHQTAARGSILQVRQSRGVTDGPSDTNSLQYHTGSSLRTPLARARPPSSCRHRTEAKKKTEKTHSSPRKPTDDLPLPFSSSPFLSLPPGRISSKRMWRRSLNILPRASFCLHRLLHERESSATGEMTVFFLVFVF